MTISTGTRGLILTGSPPIRCTEERKAARSTTAGRPVKSCIITRPGLNGSSADADACASQLARRRTSSAVTSKPSSVRNRASRSTRIENGNREISPTPCFSKASRRYSTALPESVLKVSFVLKESVLFTLVSIT